MATKKTISNNELRRLSHILTFYIKCISPYEYPERKADTKLLSKLKTISK
jgi:hypothetical protein